MLEELGSCEMAKVWGKRERLCAVGATEAGREDPPWKDYKGGTAGRGSGGGDKEHSDQQRLRLQVPVASQR